MAEQQSFTTARARDVRARDSVRLWRGGLKVVTKAWTEGARTFLVFDTGSAMSFPANQELTVSRAV